MENTSKMNDRSFGKATIFSLLLILAFSPNIFAQINKCKINGKIVYTDKDCPDDTAETLDLSKSRLPANKAAISALKYTSNEMNKDLPRMIDSATELYSTAVINDTLIYFNRVINLRKSELNIPQVKDTLRKQVKNHFCSSPDTKYFRDNDLKMKHTYVDKDDIFITSFITSRSIC